MKKLFKKIMGVAIAGSLAFGVACPTFVSAAPVTGSCGSNATYSYDSSTGTLTISGTGTISDTDSMRATNPKTIIIQKGIVDINPHTFKNYTSVTSVTLPEGLTDMDTEAFAGTTALKEITIPSTLKSHSGLDGQFEGSGLEKVTFAPGTTSVMQDICCNCPNLKTVVLPDGLQDICSGAFENCPKLETIKIPSSVTALGAATFSGTSIKEIVLPKGIASLFGVGESPFEDTKEAKATLEKATFEDGATTVPQNMFRNTSSLKSVTLAESITSIGANAFTGCTNLETVTIYGNVTTIFDDAFTNCSKVTIIGYSGSYAETFAVKNNIKFQSLGQLPPKVNDKETVGNLIYKVTDAAVDGTGKVAVVGLKKTKKSVTIPEKIQIRGYSLNVTEIAAKAFQKKSKLKTIKIQSKKITKMGKNAFKGIYKKATFKVPAKKKKAYKKMIKKAGAPKKVKIK